MGAETTLETIGKLLEGAADDVDDPEVRYKINSARQMLDVMEHQDNLLNEKVTMVADEDVKEKLRDLGYLN